jgi:hypothetical protein
VFQAEVVWGGVRLGTGRGKRQEGAEACAAADALRQRAWEAGGGAEGDAAAAVPVAREAAGAPAEGDGG